MSTPAIVIGVIIFVIVVILIVLIVNMTQIVPQEKRLVIRRFGKFHRIVGPGTVRIVPSLDQVAQEIEVRNHPVEITVPGIFAFMVPNELTLNFWYRFDPAEAAGGDRDKLANLLQVKEGERKRQIEVKIREALVNQVADLQTQMPLPDDAPALAGVAALAPGTPRYNKLLEGVRQELTKSLPSLGIILDTNQPIVLTRRGISDEIIEAIKRRRGREIDSEWLTEYADKLRTQFPEMSEGILTQVLASIEGVDTGKIQRLHVEGEAVAGTEVEFDMAESGSEPHLITKPMPKKPQTAPPRTGPPPHQGPPRLTKSDLAVLKSVPR